MKPNFPASNQQFRAQTQEYSPQNQQAQAQQRASSVPSFIQGPQQPQNVSQIKQQNQLLQQSRQQPAFNQSKSTRPQEYCQQHGEQQVGYCSSQKKIVCNTCIFQHQLTNQTEVKFTALVSKEIRHDFLQTFDEYKKQRQNIDQVDPHLVKQRAAHIVQSFFKKVHADVKELQGEVNQKIKHSQSLKELERILDENKELFPQLQNKGQDHFSEEKRKFDEKISRGRFAYVVKRQDFYNEMIQTLDLNAQKMTNTVEASSEQMKLVLKYDENMDLVKEKMQQIVKENIDVDMQELSDVRISIEKGGNYQQTQVQQKQSMQAVVQQPTVQQQQSQAEQANQANIFQKFPLKPVPIQQARSQEQQPPQQQQAPQQQPPAPVPMPVAPSQSQQAVASSPQTSPIQPQSVQTQRISVEEPAQAAKTSCQQDDDECQIIQNPTQNTQPQQQGPVFTENAELNQPPFFKLKAMSLLKLIPGKGWAKVAGVQLFLAKCAQMPDQSVYIIGGSTDQKSQDTVSTVTNYRIQPNGKVIMTEAAQMINSRSSFGCTVNVHQKEIYVAGGYTKGQTTKKCEAFSVEKNEWRTLPDLNEEKCATSLCVMSGKYLYCFGGFNKAENSAALLLSSIEMLNFSADQAGSDKWSMLPLKLPQLVCDMGSIPLSKDSILVFGGWLKTASQQAYILNQHQNGNDVSHSFQQVKQILDKPDFFMVTGVGMRQDADRFKVCGHAQLFTFNQKEQQFETSSTI